MDLPPISLFSFVYVDIVFFLSDILNAAKHEDILIVAEHWMSSSSLNHSNGYIRRFFCFNLLPFLGFEVKLPEIIQGLLPIRSSKQPNITIMNNHFKIRPAFRFDGSLRALIKQFPFLGLYIKGIDVCQVSCLLRDVSTVDIHVLAADDGGMWVYFGDIDVRLDFGPLIALNVIGKDGVIAIDWWFFASEQVNGRSIYDCTVRFEFYLLSLAFIVEFDPPILLYLLADIDAVEISQHALVSVKTTVHVEPVLEHDSCMIRSWWNVLSLYLDLSPAGIEGVLQLRLDNDVRRLPVH
jgi:hypothetical protein